MKTAELLRFEADLRKYLHARKTLFSPATDKVVVHVNKFTTAILDTNLQQAIAQIGIDVPPDRFFIDVCDAIVEHHVRCMTGTDRELAAKSLLEAYIYAAGSEHALEPASKTRLAGFLRRRGAKGFVALFLSLYLFNTVSVEIQDEVREKLRDLKSYEIYMLWIETVCRDFVKDAMTLCEGNLDEACANAICANIEARLLHS